MSRLVEARERIIYGPINAVLDPRETFRNAFHRAVGFVHGDQKRVIRVEEIRKRSASATEGNNLDSTTKRTPPQGF